MKETTCTLYPCLQVATTLSTPDHLAGKGTEYMVRQGYDDCCNDSAYESPVSY